MARTHTDWVCETTMFDPYDTYTCTRCGQYRRVPIVQETAMPWTTSTP